MSAPEDNEEFRNDASNVDSNSPEIKPTEEKTEQQEGNPNLPLEEHSEISEIMVTESKKEIEPEDAKESTPDDEPPMKDFSKKNERTEIMRKASDLHCPFVWQADLSVKTYGDHDIDMLADADVMFEETGFKFRRFIVNVVLCYHSFYKRLVHDSMKYLEEVENMLSFSSKKENKDYLFNRINDALFHVTHSSRIYILEVTNQKAQAKTILNKIKSYDSMSNENKAGIWAIRANVYVEYGYEGVEAALVYINQAISLDPENPYWHFMKGMYLGRLRRMTNNFAIPSEEEFQTLKKAMEMHADPTFLAFTAEVYHETVKRSKNLYEAKFLSSDKESWRKLSSELDVFSKTAASLFKKSVDLKPTCAHLLFRCGKGLMNLSPPHQDLKLAYLFFEKGLKLSAKSSYGNHAMAMYMEKHEKDTERAKKFLNVSVNRKNFQAHFDMVRIKFHESLDVEDLILDLEEMLNTFSEIPKRRKILAEIVTYYLFLNYDLGEACVHMRKLIMMNSKLCDIINNYRSAVIPLHCPLPLLDIILSEIKRKSKRTKISPEESNLFRKFIEFLSEDGMVLRKVNENLLNHFTTIVEKSFERMGLEVEDSDSDKKVHRVNDDEIHPYKNKTSGEYFKYYRSQSPVKNETVEEFFAIFKNRNDIEQEDKAGEDRNGHRRTKHKYHDHKKHKHEKRDRSRKSHRKSKYDKDESADRKRDRSKKSHRKSKNDEDESDYRRHVSNSKKHCKKRYKQYSISSSSEYSSDGNDRNHSSRRSRHATSISESSAIESGDEYRTSSSKPKKSSNMLNSRSPSLTEERNVEHASEVARKTKASDVEVGISKLIVKQSNGKISSQIEEKHPTVENDEKKIEEGIRNLDLKFDGDILLNDLKNKKIGKSEDDQIGENQDDCEERQEKILDDCVSEEHDEGGEKSRRKKHSKRKHGKSRDYFHRRHRSRSRDGSSQDSSGRSSSRRKCETDKQSSSSAESDTSKYSYSKRNEEKFSSRKSERRDRRRASKNRESDHSTASHRRHGGSSHPSPKRKSERERRRNEAGTISESSDHSYSSRKHKKTLHRKSERHNRSRDLENNESDRSTSSKRSRKPYRKRNESRELE